MIGSIDIKHKKGENSFRYKCEWKHSIIGIYGPSGSGKSTFLNLFAGLEQAQEGKIILGGNTLVCTKENIFVPPGKREIAYVFQDGRLFPHLTVKENLCFSKPYLKSKNIHFEFDDVVDLLEIRPLLPKRPRQLSGGERQRVAVGRALLSQPKMLLLDEPFSNLDRYLRKQIITYLVKINSIYKLPMMIVSHVIGDILRLTSQMLIIDKGEIQACGDVFTLMTQDSVPHIIKPRRYLNIYDGVLEEKMVNDGLYRFSLGTCKKTTLYTSSKIARELEEGTQIRFAIRPDDIALSTKKLDKVSIRNQIPGTIRNLFQTQSSTFCQIDCGIDFIVEITESALKNLGVQVGDEVYCLIKAKSVEVIYIQ
jgi:molybdate transport system ATP-binding protein